MINMTFQINTILHYSTRNVNETLKQKRATTWDICIQTDFTSLSEMSRTSLLIINEEKYETSNKTCQKWELEDFSWCHIHQLHLKLSREHTKVRGQYEILEPGLLILYYLLINSDNCLNWSYLKPRIHTDPAKPSLFQSKLSWEGPAWGNILSSYKKTLYLVIKRDMHNAYLLQ